MRRPLAFWLAFWSAFGALDLWAARNDVEGDSLSEITREVFRTDKFVGRVTFAACWAAFSVWLVHHICRRPPDHL